MVIIGFMYLPFHDVNPWRAEASQLSYHSSVEQRLHTCAYPGT